MNKDLELIKKAYGENFAKLCRSLFPQILEKEGVLPELMMNLFAPSRFLYDDVIENGKEDFQNFVMGKFYETQQPNLEKKENIPTPEELFDKAGYTLTKCESDEDVKSFMHYYKQNERLCTFRDPSRIKTHTIFFAVRKDVDDIKREDFTSPLRQDRYGTSVMSIQFTKGETSVLSIKNRYNHTVANPDNTFSNDLDNIYPGLTQSFELHYGIHQVENAGSFEMMDYVLANDGRRYRYNCEIDNVYYCPNNIIIRDGKAEYYDKSRYEIVDYFIIDKQEKSITVGHQEDGYIKDSFPEAHQNIEKIEIEKTNANIGERQIKITMSGHKDAIITTNQYGQMIKYSNHSLTSCGNAFLVCNDCLTFLDLPSLISCENGFLASNQILTSINLPNLASCGDGFLVGNSSLTEINLPKLTSCGDDILINNTKLLSFFTPCLPKDSEAYELLQSIIDRNNNEQNQAE